MIIKTRGCCISNVSKKVQVSHSFAPRYLYYMHFLRKLSTLCTNTIKMLENERVMSCRWCWFLYALRRCYLHLSALEMLASALSALPCAVACIGSVSFRYRETEKNVGLTGVPLPLCCFDALAQASKLYLLTGADKSVYEKALCIHCITYWISLYYTQKCRV